MDLAMAHDGPRIRLRHHNRSLPFEARDQGAIFADHVLPASAAKAKLGELKVCATRPQQLLSTLLSPLLLLLAPLFTNVLTWALYLTTPRTADLCRASLWLFVLTGEFIPPAL